jgi:hypothetical protein
MYICSEGKKTHVEMMNTKLKTVVTLGVTQGEMGFWKSPWEASTIF